MTEQLRLMAVHAHPDDESSKGAATLARYAAEGAETLICTLTGGERGSILNPAMDRPDVRGNIGAIRREEMRQAAEVLGARHVWLGFVDSGLPEGDPLPPLPEGCFALQPLHIAAEPLIRLVREFRPHVMTTYDEGGGYPHPDHVMCHTVSVEAFDAAGDPERYPDAGAPWQPLKLYYDRGFSIERFRALHEEMLRRGLESPYGQRLEAWAKRGVRPPAVTTRVRCDEWFSVRDRALLAHATQVDPNSFWFACPLDAQAGAWPTEDYHLARSLVETTLPEDDMFDGVREMVHT